MLKKLVDLIGITSIMEVSLLYHPLGGEILQRFVYVFVWRSLELAYSELYL